ncbi:DUF2795 domain-containing protein [Streptomyces somaliensis]|uniref:DUF2795 domain-containing protein n=1 Tax=Streptomyces somaliensis TaxID=78355 RepID=UPI0034E93252|nr:DUF2795 domain-containing protein [Streptomyces somaliensis]
MRAVLAGHEGEPHRDRRTWAGSATPRPQDEILRQAEEHGAGKEVMVALKSLPDKNYDFPAAINKEVAGDR